MNRFCDDREAVCELGARLRELRLGAGLSQGQVMLRAGRKGKGLAGLASRLETGRLRQFTLGFVADYLRACRARFSDVAEVLDRYTEQRVALDQQVHEELRRALAEAPREVRMAVLSYDVKRTASLREDAAAAPRPRKQPLTEDARKRVEQALKLAQALTIDRIALGAMRPVLLDHAAVLTPGRLRALASFGRKVVAAKVRYYDNKRRAHRRARRRALESAIERVIELVGDTSAVDEIGLVASSVANRLRELGKLEQYFALDYGERVVRRLDSQRYWKQDDKRWDKRAARRSAEQLGRWSNTLQYMTTLAVNGELAYDTRDRELRGKAARLAQRVLDLARLTRPGSASRRRRVDELGREWGDVEQFRQAADKGFQAYEYWQNRKPGQESQPAVAAPVERTPEEWKQAAQRLSIFLDGPMPDRLDRSTGRAIASLRR